MNQYQDLIRRMIKAGVPIAGSPGLIITDRLLRDAAEDVGGHSTILLTREAMTIATGRSMNGFARAAFDRVEWDVNALTGLRHWRVSMEFIPYDGSYQEGGDEYGIAFPTPKRQGIFPHSMAARCRLIREADQSRIRLVRFEQPIARPLPWEMRPRPADVPITIQTWGGYGTREIQGPSILADDPTQIPMDDEVAEVPTLCAVMCRGAV